MWDSKSTKFYRLILVYLLTELMVVKGMKNLNINKKEQERILNRKEQECNDTMKEEVPLEGLYCNITWDNISCWPATKAGTIAVKSCPDYISGLDITQNVTRRCNADGTWYVNPDTNKTWSDYLACASSSDIPPIVIDEDLKEHMERISIMVHVGHGLSLASLVAAIIIMLYFKKLHCPRNTIHINMFLSFILKAVISFIKEGLFINNVGFEKDVYRDSEGHLRFIPGGLHWECRLFTTIVYYIMGTNYAWIFVEALYLQMLISIAVFREKKHLHFYMVFGWTLPLVFMIPYVIVRVTYANTFCWTTHSKKWIAWIFHGPILLTIVINFMIFINIVRVLFTKLNASPCPETKKFRYRRLAKSTLVLIPLFGVYYMVFSIIYNITEKYEGIGLIVYLYIEMFFNSFQGFFLSLLFCFFNSEVQNEFKKAWRRYALQRSGSSRWRSTFTTRTKSWKEHRNSETNGVTGRGDKVGPNECELPSSPTSMRSPITQSSYAYDLKSNQVVANQDIEVNEQTPWLNNNHTSCEEQHVPPFDQADERL